MVAHKKNNKAEALKASLSALVASSATAGASQPAPSEPRKAPKKAPEPPPEPSGEQFIRLGLSLFPKDFEQISAIMSEGLKRGQRLNQSQAIRLALRSLDLGKLATAEMEAVRLDDRRRKTPAQKAGNGGR